MGSRFKLNWALTLKGRINNKSYLNCSVNSTSLALFILLARKSLSLFVWDLRNFLSLHLVMVCFEYRWLYQRRARLTREDWKQLLASLQHFIACAPKLVWTKFDSAFQKRPMWLFQKKKKKNLCECFWSAAVLFVCLLCVFLSDAALGLNTSSTLDFYHHHDTRHIHGSVSGRTYYVLIIFATVTLFTFPLW